MALKGYGFLKGRPISYRLADSTNQHFQIHMVDEQDDYRIAVNVLSQLPPSEVEFIVVEDFQHPIMDEAREHRQGWKPLDSKKGGLSLDFIRSNLFERDQMQPLPYNLPGMDNDLNEKLEQRIRAAIQDESAMLYAFGQRWGPENNVKDKIFGFKPGNGVHDIHMNQGNPPGRFFKDNGIYQDGGLIIDYPRVGKAVGIFLKFQSQAWHTDDVKGNPMTQPTPVVPVPGGEPGEPGTVPPFEPSTIPGEGEPDYRVRILAALVDPKGPDQGLETVTLLNTTSDTISLDGWHIADRQKNKQPLSGNINAGETRAVRIIPPVALSNKGSIITLLDRSGTKVHGVSYTHRDLKKEGVSIVF